MGIEGLGDEIVHACLEALLPVLDEGVGRHREDRHAGAIGLLANQPRRLQAVQLGGGQDVIDNQYQLKTDFDQLQFGEGINANQLWFERTGDDLKVSIIGTNDSITVENWYGEVHDWYYNYQDMTHQLDQFTLSDGRALVASQVDSLVQAMASFAPPVPGQTVLPDAYQSTLNSVIASSWR